MSDIEKPIPSPCISVCALDDEDVCMGCFRTADEIREWSVLDNPGRKKVLKESMLRSRKANPFA
ncbi:DUF1289 domain-containing protein [Porticoccaceae bacterium LTM1]|nr:DUF1289 domain-containing protein [Porticoccaceae bacterium LTM1]